MALTLAGGAGGIAAIGGACVHYASHLDDSPESPRARKQAIMIRFHRMADNAQSTDLDGDWQQV
jgi:hypothetical protein